MSEGSVADRIARSFDRQARESAADIKALPEQAPISASLMALLGDVEEVRPSLLDVGCGTGAASIRLAQRGAHHVTGIDLSPASIEVAESRRAKAGLDETKARFEVADAALVPLPPHEWVLLDRVICCYRNANILLTNAISAAGSRLAFSVPESRGVRGALNSIGWGAENLWKAAFRRDACRGFVHEVTAIERLLAAAGFQKLRESRRRLWYAAVYERSTPGSLGERQPDLNHPSPSST